MAYPTGLKIYIDDVDCTWFIFGTNAFNPTELNDTLRNIDITPYLRIPDILETDRQYKGNQTSNIHTIEITAADGNGRVECRVEVR